MKKKLKRKRVTQHFCQSHRAWVMTFDNRLPLWWFPYPKNIPRHLFNLLSKSDVVRYHQWCRRKRMPGGRLHVLPLLIYRKQLQLKNGNKNGFVLSENNVIRNKRKKLNQPVRASSRYNKKESVMSKHPRSKTALDMYKNRNNTSKALMTQANCVSWDIAVKESELKTLSGDNVYLNPMPEKTYTIDLTNIQRSNKSEYDIDTFSPVNTLADVNDESVSHSQYHYKSIKLCPKRTVDEKHIFKSETLPEKLEEKSIEYPQLTEPHTLIKEATAMIAGLTALVTPYDDRLDYLTAYQFNCILMPIHDKLVYALKLIASDSEKDNDSGPYSMH